MKNTVSQQEITELLEKAEIEVKTIFDKTTVVAVKLENGFVLVESSSCVDKINYSEELGKEICLKRIENTLWLLLGFELQNKIFKESKGE